MGVYERFILPRLVHWACGLSVTRRQRERVVPMARGRVLEIGIGSGLNLRHYDPRRVTRIWGLDPSPPLREMAARAAQGVPIDVELLDAPAEEIPLENHAVDTIMMTYTLCSISDPERALRAMARVLAADGRLIFCEHGLAPAAGARRWQQRLDPLWSRITGGCHLSRPIPDLIRRSGFHITTLKEAYLPGWKPASYNYWGVARVGQSRPATCHVERRERTST